MPTNFWTREELILAFNLYLKLPFGKMHKHTPEIIALAELLGRTPSSIGMRLGNFASCDPQLQARGIGGLKGGMNQVKPIWDEFYENQEDLVFLSEQILANRQKIPLEVKFKDALKDIGSQEGKTSIMEVKVRVNQSVFRTMVLNNYFSKCCITGLSVPKLLVASHIVPWSKDVKNRLNPENGLCLSSIHDKAFDSGYITITTEYKVRVSKALGEIVSENVVQKFFVDYDNQQITLPERYNPNLDFLDYHYHQIFIK